MKTLRQVLELSKGMLERKSVPSSRRVAEEILSNALHISRMDFYLHFDRYVPETDWRRCLSQLERRMEGEPVEHILKTIQFFRCNIEVNRSALIPRQESEILLQKVYDALRSDDRSSRILLDLCTGTGCLGLGMKKAFPELDVYLSDISPDCLKLANRNAVRNGLDVTLLQGDLLKPFGNQKAHYLICNPPYIPEDEYATLDPSVKDFEPKIALIGGESGLEFYERLESELPNYLHPGAKLFFEIGYNQGETLSNVFSASHWKSVRYEKDWAANDRFFFLEFQPDVV